MTSVTIPRSPTCTSPDGWAHSGAAGTHPLVEPVLDHFAWHEGRHIKIQQAYDTKLRPLLLGHKCSSARTIIRRWERTVAAAQARFDTRDYSWQPETSVPYKGP